MCSFNENMTRVKHGKILSFFCEKDVNNKCDVIEDDITNTSKTLQFVSLWISNKNKKRTMWNKMNGFRSFQFLLLFVFRLAIFYFTPLTLFCNIRVEFAKYETIYFSLKYENNALTYSYKIYERTQNAMNLTLNWINTWFNMGNTIEI